MFIKKCTKKDVLRLIKQLYGDLLAHLGANTFFGVSGPIFGHFKLFFALRDNFKTKERSFDMIWYYV